MDNTLSQAKKIITAEAEEAGYRITRLLLFGSRARGDPRPDSDWDFYVIVDRDLGYNERWDLSDRIRQRFVQAGFYADVFIQSEKVVREREGNTGFLAYYVLKEGVEI